MAKIKTDGTPTVLRKGFTTGTCAQAAAKAAALMLTQSAPVENIDVTTPSGAILTLPVIEAVKEDGFARCAVVKDSGDDPDTTDGIKIYAEVRFSPAAGVTVKGGNGVGKITKPGLAQAIGEDAINPIPKKMIIKEVMPYLPEGRGLEVIISAPEGEQLALSTFNPRLGIVGGISILGTTGIVEPKSQEAYKASLALQLDVLKAQGYDKAVLALGYVSEKFCRETLKVRDETIVKIGDHVGFMLQQCADKKIREVILAGHIGKLIKVARGQFNTHYQYGDARADTIASFAASAGAPAEMLKEITAQATAEAAADVAMKNSLPQIFDAVARVTVEKINTLVSADLKITCFILNLQGKVLGRHPVE